MKEKRKKELDKKGREVFVKGYGKERIKQREMI